MSLFQDARDVTVLGGSFLGVAPGSTVHYHEGGEQGVSSAFKGKSAIMQSIVERCSPHNVILGTFFFSRSDPSRNFAEVLIPTLAYQIVCAFRAAISVVERVLKRIPHIFKSALHIMVRELLVPLIRHLSETGEIGHAGPQRKVFVIDGLDECSNPLRQASIINSITTILCQFHLPVLFIIASRPELAISSAFLAEKQLYELMESVTLDDDDDTRADIHQYVEDSFSDIVNFHPLRHHITLPWPHPQSIERLVSKSSGHFVYAAVAMKFIASGHEHPMRALRVIEGLESSRSGKPFSELDVLYLHIINSAAHRTHVVRILRHCLLTKFADTIPSVCSIFNTSPEDIDLFLSDVQALISISFSAIEGQIVIKPKHASLGDFLQDSARSQDLYMTQGDYHASLLTRYFELFDAGLRSSTPFLSEYSSDLHRSENVLVSAICEAIKHSRTTPILAALLSRYSPRDIWNFCLRCRPPSLNVCGYSASLYMKTIRDSTRDTDGSLYMRYFPIYMQLLFDDIRRRPNSGPQERIFPALLCTTSLPALPVVYYLSDEFCRSLVPGEAYIQYLDHLLTPLRADPLTIYALMHLPQRQLSWTSDLTLVMKLVLQKVLNHSWTPQLPFSSPHMLWLRSKKPSKRVALGSPRLSTRFYNRLQQCPKPRMSDMSDPVVHHLTRHGYSLGYARFLSQKRIRLFMLLKAIIYFLHKCGCTSEIADLAHRSLPKLSLWFPKEMKQARREMDTYVLSWQDSLEGLFERVQLFSIDGVD